VLGEDVHAVFMPVAFDVQTVRIATAAAVANAFWCGAVLQSSVEAGHVDFILKVGAR
jgi:hypothetical protein